MTPSDPVELAVVVVILLLAFLHVGIVGWRLVFVRRRPLPGAGSLFRCRSRFVYLCHTIDSLPIIVKHSNQFPGQIRSNRAIIILSVYYVYVFFDNLYTFLGQISISIRGLAFI